VPVQLEDLGTSEEERTRNFLEVLHGLRGCRCFDCTDSVCLHEAVMSVVLGFKDAPRCCACLAAGLGREPADLRDQVYDYVRWKGCFFSGWQLASEEEGFGNSTRPRCLWPDDDEPQIVPPVVVASRSPAAVASSSGAPVEQPISAPAAASSDREWDAGELSCGDLVLELRIRLAAMEPGTVLRIRSLDPAAPEDLPAWCRLTGHALVGSTHPDYWIRRKEK